MNFFEIFAVVFNCALYFKQERRGGGRWGWGRGCRNFHLSKMFLTSKAWAIKHHNHSCGICKTDNYQCFFRATISYTQFYSTNFSPDLLLSNVTWGQCVVDGLSVTDGSGFINDSGDILRYFGVWPVGNIWPVGNKSP